MQRRPDSSLHFQGATLSNYVNKQVKAVAVDSVEKGSRRHRDYKPYYWYQQYANWLLR